MREIKLDDLTTILIPTLDENEERKRLKNFYDVCNKLFKDKPEYFYTSEEVKKLKEDPNNKFI